MTENEKGKILILECHNKLLSMLVRSNRIVEIRAERKAEAIGRLGNIYVGKVQNISSNIGAAFVEIGKGVIAFLPLAEASEAVLTNRNPDGSLKTGDELLVQVVREPVKTKQTGISAVLSLPGIYAAVEYRRHFPPKDKEAGVRTSAKMSSRFRHLNADGMEDVSPVVKEAEALAAQMTRILEIGNKRVCFSCLYQSEPEYLSFVKNCYQSEYDEIVTDRKDIYETLLASEYTKSCRVRLYEDTMLPLYKLYSVETRIQELLSKKVWLKSGAYLIIEQTEALVAIDVNTGKYEAGKEKEATYLKINLEAADAIAEAIRARNLSGMILVDFINMRKKEHIKQLTESMKAFLAKDSVPSFFVDITGLGLMEITRKKKSKSFAEQMKE